VVVTEAYKTGAFTSELIALVNEAAFDWLDAPIERVCGADVPVPMAESLEDAAIPNAARIAAAVRKVMR
jgi:pyruvate/2-oxoglutarate/acetoin dehydrogenase E1 component